ncbi:SDR family NAD(P)-dependent oxidoreductase, partial [Vibrio sp. 10N.222.55.E8]
MILGSFNLEGKVAIVTGCDTGLGQGMAIGLAEAGCKVVGVNYVEPTETIEKMNAAGHTFLDVRANLLK